MAGKKSEKVAASFAKAFGSKPVHEDVRWKYVDKDLLHRLVDAVVACNGLVSFAATRDRSAYVITFLHDNIDKEDRKWYLGNVDSVNDHLLYWAETWEGILEAQEDGRASEKH